MLMAMQLAETITLRKIWANTIVHRTLGLLHQGLVTENLSTPPIQQEGQVLPPLPLPALALALPPLLRLVPPPQAPLVAPPVVAHLHHLAHPVQLVLAPPLQALFPPHQVLQLQVHLRLVQNLVTGITETARGDIEKKYL